MFLLLDLEDSGTLFDKPDASDNKDALEEDSLDQLLSNGLDSLARVENIMDSSSDMVPLIESISSRIEASRTCAYEKDAEMKVTTCGRCKSEG